MEYMAMGHPLSRRGSLAFYRSEAPLGFTGALRRSCAVGASRRQAARQYQLADTV